MKNNNKDHLKPFIYSVCGGLFFVFMLLPSNKLFSQNDNPSLSNWQPFQQVNYFESGSSTVQFGLGLNSIIATRKMALENDGFNAKFLTPALSVTYERSMIMNLGIGISVGSQMWRVPKIEAFNEKFRFKYRLFTIGIRSTYRLNIAKRWDLYSGLAITYRYMDITRSIKALDSNWHLGATLLYGVKYYWSDHLGAFVEIGSETTSVYRIGITKYMYQPRKSSKTSTSF